MHIQKLLVTIFAAGAVGAGSLHAQGSDSDVQAKMREALRQKIAELNAQGGSTAPAPTPTPTAPVAPTPAPAPADVAPAASAPAPSGGLTPEQEARVRAALREATAAPSAPVTAQPAPVVPPAAPAPVPPPAPITPPPAPAPVAVEAVVAPAPASSHHRLSPEDEARVRAALHQAEENPSASAPAPVPATPDVSPTIPAPAAPVVQASPEDEMARKKKLQDEIMERQRAAEQADTEKKQAEMGAKKKMQDEAAQRKAAEAAAKKQAQLAGTSNSTPEAGKIAPAPAPAPGSKEQRLADLLQLYKTDKISPVEYHEQRAKIINEP